MTSSDNAMGYYTSALQRPVSYYVGQAMGV